jgi:hypothetical protein
MRRHLRQPLALLAVLLIAALPAGARRLAANPTPITTDDIMAQAKSQAAAEHKNILLAFSASWCGPCHLFEHFLADPAIHPIMDKVFVMTTLDVGERPTDTRHANTPGAEQFRSALGGKDAGYPYIIMLDPAGKPIVDSFRPDKHAKNGAASIGYPDSPAEVDWFMQMLQKAAPSLSPQDTKTIHAWLTAHGHS